VRGFSFHPLADDELIEAIRFYERRAPGLGRSFLQEVRSALDRVLTAPESAQVIRDEVRAKPLHRFPYSLLYTLESGTIRVLAVMHQHRSPERFAGRR